MATSRLRAAVVFAMLATMLSGCAAVTKVQSPLSFAADRDLKMLSPGDGDEVDLPVTLRWRYEGSLEGGRHFGVFVDKAPLGRNQPLRLRYCTVKESEPVLPGEERDDCHDDRLRVFQPTAPTITLNCIDARKGVREVRQHTHTATVVVLDGDGRRVGRAATRVTFEVRKRSARQCPVFND
jgi:hypothetical protein